MAMSKEYAGQRKVGKDIEKKIKKEKSSTKATAKRKAMKKVYYYAKIAQQNKNNN